MDHTFLVLGWKMRTEILVKSVIESVVSVEQQKVLLMRAL